MDINRSLSQVIKDQVFLQLTDPANRALQYLLDEDSFLRVDNLVETRLKLAVDLDILNV